MSFIQFALNNIKRNIKSYLGYFFSILISSTLLFSFRMFINHPDLDTSLFENYIIAAMQVTEVIIYLFLSLFVFYSASVFLKSRNKEFGVLYTIGISKKQVKKMIFVENLIINILASVFGIVVGLIFAKVVLIIISSLIGIEPLKFYISTKSIAVIILYFTLLSMLTSYFISFVVREDKVIKLLKGTQTPKPEPKSSPILAVFCVGVLVYAYYMAVSVTMSDLFYKIAPVTFMVIMATYLLFSQLSVFVIKKVKGKKAFYKKNTNMLSIANLHYKIKDNTRMLFLVTITSAIAFTAIGSVYSYWMSRLDQVEAAYPQAIFYATESGNLNEDNVYKDVDYNKSDYSKRVDLLESLLEKDKISYDKVEGQIKTIVAENTDKTVKIIKESDYIKLSKSKSNVSKLNINNKNNNVMTIDNKSMKVKYADKSVMPAYYSAYVVKDDFYNSISLDCIEDKFIAINTKNYMKTLGAIKSFEDVYKDEVGYKLLSRASMVDHGRIVYAVLLFLSIFIGLIFFITSSSFLYNKLYVDCQDDKRKYRNLNKIGLTYKEIRKAVTVEIATLFLLPYVVAVIHSAFALLALKNSLDVDVAGSSFLVMGSFFVVLLIYFLIVRQGYLNEIKENLVD